MNLDLEISGNNNKPVVLGFVETKEGHIILKGRNFEIKNMKMLFDSKEIIDPNFTLETEADYKTHKVMMNIRGRLKGDIRVNFTSHHLFPKKECYYS